MLSILGHCGTFDITMAYSTWKILQVCWPCSQIPIQLSVAYITVLKVMESWVGVALFPGPAQLYVHAFLYCKQWKAGWGWEQEKARFSYRWIV